MHSWERQNGEKERDWILFQAFKTCRNKMDVAREHGITSANIYRIAKYWWWNKRVKEYDNWLQAAEDEVIYAGRKELAREHLDVIRKAREIADEALTTLLASLRSAQDGESGLAPRDALAYLEKAVTLERLVTGEATERVEAFDLTKISGDEAEALLETLEKMK